MKTQSTVTKSRAVAAAGHPDAKVDTQVYTAGLSAVGISACAIGVWAAASLIGGLIASGGPVALVADWFTAVFGL